MCISGMCVSSGVGCTGVTPMIPMSAKKGNGMQVEWVPGRCGNWQVY